MKQYLLRQVLVTGSTSLVMYNQLCFMQMLNDVTHFNKIAFSIRKRAYLVRLRSYNPDLDR